MERGSDKHGPLLDDEMEQETDSLVKGAPPEARAGEGREKEGPAEGEPTPDSRIAGDRGGMSPGREVNPRNLEWRHEIQRYLQGRRFPASRDELLASAAEMQATDDVKDLLRSLRDDKTYATLEEVWSDLGGKMQESHK